MIDRNAKSIPLVRVYSLQLCEKVNLLETPRLQFRIVIHFTFQFVQMLWMLVLCQRQTSRNLSAACKTEHYNTQHCNTVSQGTCAIWVFDFKEGYDENTRYKEEDFFHICQSGKCYKHATSIALSTRCYSTFWTFFRNLQEEHYVYTWSCAASFWFSPSPVTQDPYLHFSINARNKQPNTTIII